MVCAVHGMSMGSRTMASEGADIHGAEITLGALKEGGTCLQVQRQGCLQSSSGLQMLKLGHEVR